MEIAKIIGVIEAAETIKNKKIVKKNEGGIIVDKNIAAIKSAGLTKPIKEEIAELMSILKRMDSEQQAGVLHIVSGAVLLSNTEKER